MRNAAVCFLISALICATHVIAQSASDYDEIAEANFPPELSGVDGLARHKACTALYPVASGQSLLMAGYVAGGLQVLRKDSDGRYHRVTLYAPENLFLDGAGCNLDLVDLDNDGAPEVRLVLYGPTGSPFTRDWYLRWDGSKFINLTPVEDQDTQLLGTVTQDLDLDGRLEVISLQPEPGGTIHDERDFNAGEAIYALDPTGLHKQKDITYSDAVLNTAGAPMTEEMTLSFRQPPQGDFQLTIINGSTGGARRASAGLVDVNGETVMTPNELNQNVSTISKVIRLKQSNSIHVTMDGPPGSQLSLIIEPKPANEPLQ